MCNLTVVMLRNNIMCKTCNVIDNAVVYYYYVYYTKLLVLIAYVFDQLFADYGCLINVAVLAKA